MDHFKILKRAWDIVWKYRALWLIGLVLVLVGGAVGGFRGSPGSSGSPSGSSGGQDSSGGTDGENWPGTSIQNWDAFWEKVMPIVVTVAIVVAVIVVLAVLLNIVRLILRYVTRTSLIEMVDRYEETETKVGFMDGLRLGWSRSSVGLFLTKLILSVPSILIALLGVLVGMALAIVITVLVIVTVKSGGGGAIAAAVILGIAAFFLFIIVLLPLILIGTILRVIISVLIEIAFRVCVLQKRGAWESIKEAVALIRRNLWPTALQALLMVGLGIAWNIALFVVNLPLVFLAFLIAGLPSLALGGIVALLASPIPAIIAGVLIFVAVMIVVIGLPNLAFSTFATVYHSTVWTLTYRELQAIDAGEDEETETIEVKANLE
ncbi:MAG: hypothetical protein JW934_07030 [Anaerolineae bacterium]|nr:hypothetical protein [Anaerolineae bacterium]